MALGAKLKLGFIDGSCVKPTSDHDESWIRCDYMVTCWILNLMVTELSDAFLYAQSACELWKEIGERYVQSNGPLFYQLERELIRSQILAMDHLLTINKAYDIVQQIEKQKQVTNHVFEPTAFFSNMNNKNNSNGRRENNKGNRNEIKGETKNEISFKKVCTNYGKEGHLFEQCFERLGYPDWYKGKKAKKNNRLAAHVTQVLMSTLVEKLLLTWDMRMKGKAISEDQGGASSSHAAMVIPNILIPTEPDNENSGNENSNSSTNSIPQNVNSIPLEPTRRSTRQSTKTVWLKGLVAPTGTKSGPHYPLFASTYFPGISQQHIAFLANVFAQPEPTRYQQAIQHPGWVEAMNKELEALEKNNGLLLNCLQDIRLLHLKISMLPPEGYTKAKPGRLVGRLLYLTMTRLDISYVVQHLSQFVSSPKDIHLQDAIHLLKYLKGTASKGLFYPIQPHLQVTGFTDVDWASCLMTKKSLTEYRNMATTTCKLLWLSFLLKDLHIPVKLLITLFCDNKFAQQIAANPCFHERAKHMDIDSHLTRDKVHDGFLQTAFIPSYLQLADIMTKALNSVQHSFLDAKLGVSTAPTSGEDKKHKD
uniref:Reverse transcriptase Ty1/copia-type domain-containing protein n=1 Tax=Tanacetum cinerariifolium TaxID=118510 RepID=A0A6L2MYM4_TANCI|nr:hypothetical protein [Tanacetum cinerariifolium]